MNYHREGRGELVNCDEVLGRKRKKTGNIPPFATKTEMNLRLDKLRLIRSD
ncbi:sensor histidine kinase, partial [Sesbania bispinosa]